MSSPAPLPRAGDPGITDEVVADHGLSPEEYEQILEILGREPTFTELGVFSAMWSEHCGYKNSKRLLRLLPTKAPWVIQGPGENAGVIDIGQGFALAFKIESHNHPSAVEPYQGAATGVGGISGRAHLRSDRRSRYEGEATAGDQQRTPNAVGR